MLDLSVGESGKRHLLPEFAGMVASGCVAWLTCPAPPANSLSWVGIGWRGLGYFLLCAAVGFGVTWWTAAFQRIPARFSAALLWLPSLALLLSQRSAWAGLAAVVVGWHVSRSIFASRGGLFRTLVPSIEATCSAICGLGGVVAAAIGRPILATALLGIGSALVAWSSGRFRVTTETRRRWATVAFALFLTVAGMLRFLQAGSGDSAGAGRAAAESREGLGPVAEGLGGTFKGVILLPEAPRQVVLVPPKLSLRHDLFKRTRSTPLDIPFFGVYWLFRFPAHQPPPNSYVVKGSPLTSGFHTSDYFPLTMEAHQNFGTLIDLQCCSEIQLAIRNADHGPGIISLELVLTNTTVAGKPSVSLGRRSIAPTAGFPGDHSPPTQTVLSFDVPRGGEIQKFDEATILYRRTFSMASARVAIDRFIFVPRGFRRNL